MSVRRRRGLVRLATALAFSPLVSLVGVAIVGLELGVRSIVDLAVFVSLWALNLYPLVVGISLIAYCVVRRLGITSAQCFTSGGVLLGTLLTLAWFGIGGTSPLEGLVVFGICGGFVGAASAWVFWRLAIAEVAV